MIIVRKGDTSVAIPCGLGPVVCPDTSHELQMKQVDPSTSTVTVEPDSLYYGLYRVIVNPISDALDPDLIAENIKNGVEIFGVTGSFEGGPLQSKTLNPSTAQQTVTPDASYYGLSDVTVNAITAAIDPDLVAGNIKKDVEILGVVGTFEGGALQSKSVDSSTESQTITPDGTNYGLSSVTVNPYTVESQSETITQNGQYSFAPDEADALSGVTIDVQVEDIPAVIQTKSVTYTQNGTYTVTKDNGYDGMSSVTVDVSVDSEEITLESKTVNSSTVSQTVTYDDTQYDGLSSVTVNPYTLENKTVNSSTVQQSVTASSADGLAMVTVEPYVLDSKTVNPSTSSITVTSSEDGLSSVTINPINASIDADLIPENIKNGVEIFGVTGNYSGQSINNQNKTVNSSTTSQTVTADSGYTGLGTVTVNPYTLDTKTVNPSINSVTVNSSADGMSQVTVNAVTASIDSNITTGNIKNGVTILGVTGTYDGSGGGGGDSSLYAVMNFMSLTLGDNNESTSTYVDTGATILEELTGFDMVFKAPESEDGNKHWIFGCEHTPLRSPAPQLPFFGAYVIYDILYISAGQTQDESVTLDNGTYHFDKGIYIVAEPVEDPEDAENIVWQIMINNNKDDLYYLPYETLSGYNPICIFAKGDGNGNYSEFAESGAEFGYASIWNDDAAQEFYAAGEIIKNDDGTLSTSIAETPYIMVYDWDFVNDSHTVDLIAPETGRYDEVRAYNIGVDYINIYEPSAGTYMMPFSYSMPAFTHVEDCYVNADSLIVNPSTSSQIIYPYEYDVDYFVDVTVNAVTAAIDPNITAGNIKKNVTILGVTGTYDASDASSSGDVYLEWRKGNNTDLSSLDISELMSIQGGAMHMFDVAIMAANGNPRTISRLPVMDASTIAANAMQSCFDKCMFTGDASVITFPNVVTISGSNACRDMLYDTTGVKSISFPELTTISGESAFRCACSVYGNYTLETVNLPKLQNVSGLQAVSSWIGWEASTGIKLTIHPDALRYSDIYWNVGYWIQNLSELHLTDDVTNNIYLTSTASTQSAQAVYEILSKLDLTVSDKSVNFNSNGITVEDYQDGRIQDAYDDATNAGWTINNLTITPYSPPGPHYVEYVETTGTYCDIPVPETFCEGETFEWDSSLVAGQEFVTGNILDTGYFFRNIFCPDWSQSYVYIDYPRDSHRVTINASYMTGGRHMLVYTWSGTTLQVYSDGQMQGSLGGCGGSYSGHYCGFTGCDNSFQPAGERTYGLKWYRDVNGVQTLVHDYKPAIDPSNVVGFYDEVTQTYLLPTSGSLNAGPDVQ